MNDVTKDEGVVDVATHALELMLKEGASCAREGLDYLSCWEKDVGL
jgi:hypothetical protein